MKKNELKIDLRRLKAMGKSLKAISDKGYKAQIGIFGSHANRRNSPGGLSNADIGFIHEMGAQSRGIPRRSFLRDSLAYQRTAWAKAAKEVVAAFFGKGDIMLFLKGLGVQAENLVQQAFDTGGFGKWPQLKYETILGKTRGNLSVRKQKAAAQLNEGAHYAGILINTGQLRRSVASRVVHS